MNRPFRIHPLDGSAFEPLFAMSDDELSRRNARRMIADEKPGYPCRVSLQDAEIGEEVMLLQYHHHTADSPYRASGPIYVRRSAATAVLAVDEIPAMLLHRLLSVRAYDADAMMVEAAVVDGKFLREAINAMFGKDTVAYLHIHNAKPGCYNCTVTRA